MQRGTVVVLARKKTHVPPLIRMSSGRFLQMPALLDKRLIVVTGKGGVGKTTVAVALGLAAARAGKRTMVAEVGPAGAHLAGVPARGARLLGGRARRQPVRHVDRPGARAEGVPRPADRRRARRPALHDNRIFEYFAAAAPGVRELATVGKVWELAQPAPARSARRPYDLVIMDAPASGNGLALLRSPRTFGEHRARRPDPPARRHDPRVPHRPARTGARGRGAAAGDAGERDARVPREARGRDGHARPTRSSSTRCCPSASAPTRPSGSRP